MWLCMLLYKRLEDPFENTQWRKVTQMQPMRVCNSPCKRFEGTFEDTQWRKAKQTQALWWCYCDDNDCDALTGSYFPRRWWWWFAQKGKEVVLLRQSTLYCVVHSGYNTGYNQPSTVHHTQSTHYWVGGWSSFITLMMPQVGMMVKVLRMMISKRVSVKIQRILCPKYVGNKFDDAKICRLNEVLFVKQNTANSQIFQTPQTWAFMFVLLGNFVHTHTQLLKTNRRAKNLDILTNLKSNRGTTSRSNQIKKASWQQEFHHVKKYIKCIN